MGTTGNPMMAQILGEIRQILVGKQRSPGDGSSGDVCRELLHR